MSPRVFERIVDRPWLTLALVIALVILAASGLDRLRFITGYKVFFDNSNPDLQAFENLQATYSKNDSILFVLAPNDKNVFTRPTLGAIQQLSEKAWQIPFSRRADSLSTYQHTYAEEDDLVVAPLYDDTDTLTDEHIAAIRQTATHEPLLVNRILSPDGAVTGVLVSMEMPGEDPQSELPKVADYVRGIVEWFEASYPDIPIYITGIVIMDATFAEATAHDLGTLVPTMFLIILAVLTLLLRQWSATFAVVLVLVFSVVAAMGMAGYAGIGLTAPTMSAPTIILTLAVADSVHLLMTYFHNLYRGRPRREAMLESLRINAQPVFITSATTAIGFLSMNFSESPPFRDLGNITAIGVMIAYGLSVVFLPALMMLLPANARKGDSAHNAIVHHIGEFVVRRYKALLVFLPLVCLILIAMVPRNELNDEFVKYFDKSIRFRADTDFATQNLTGIYTIEFSLPAGRSGGIADPAYLTHLDAFANWLRQQPEVLHVNTIADILKRLNRNMHGDQPEWYKLPESQELAAQYLLLYEMSLPYGLDLNNQINIDKSATRVSVSLHSLSTNELLDLDRRTQDWLRAYAPALQSPGTGTTMMFSRVGARNILSMLSGTLIALVLISVLLIFALRSVSIGLLSLIPNLVPASMAFGIWGIFVGQIGLSHSIVMGMTLGIVVDDTVHFLSKYLRARQERNFSPLEAVRYAFDTVGNALLVTTVVLVAGFLTLALSAFEMNASTGLLTAITIAVALVTDFFLLPPLLIAVDRNRGNAKSASD
ncbi:MAG: MMPL family transporter [Chromatiales bacterium]|nr:MMPL family transporter [Chromatiales bacterium]